MKNSHEVGRGLFISSLQAQLVWIISAVLLLLIVCAIAFSTEDPDNLIFPLSLCALYLSAVIGGIVAVRLSGDGILSGFISGLITIVLIRLLSLLPIPVSDTELSVSILCTVMVLPAYLVGSVIGHKRKDKNKRNSRFKKNIR